MASPQVYSIEFPSPPNGPQCPDVGQGGERSTVPSYEQALQAQVASLQAQFAAATAAMTAGHTGPPMGEVGASPPPPPPPLRQDVFSRCTGVPPVVSGDGAHPAPSGPHPAPAGGGHHRLPSTSMAEIWACAADGQQALGYFGS